MQQSPEIVEPLFTATCGCSIILVLAHILPVGANGAANYLFFCKKRASPPLLGRAWIAAMQDWSLSGLNILTYLLNPIHHLWLVVHAHQHGANAQPLSSAIKIYRADCL